MTNQSKHDYLCPKKLIDFCGIDLSSITIWDDSPVTHSMIHEAIASKAYQDSPYNPDAVWTPSMHARRVAYLVANGWQDPIEIDVGIPGFGLPNHPIQDGNHRLIAAAFRNDAAIACSASGSLNTIRSLRAKRRSTPDLRL